MRIISVHNITKEIENALKKEQTCILSSDEEYWLFTDIGVFNNFKYKFRFDVETEEREKIHAYNVETYLLYKYDGGAGEYNYFGCPIELATYRTKVSELAHQNGLGTKWDKQLDQWSKDFAIDEIILKIQESLDTMKFDGWDIAKLKKRDYYADCV